MGTFVHFEERRDGRTDAMLGIVTVGTVIAIDHPELRAAWAVDLPGCPKPWRPAADAEAAKHALIKAAHDWLRAAGLLTQRRRGRR